MKRIQPNRKCQTFYLTHNFQSPLKGLKRYIEHPKCGLILNRRWQITWYFSHFWGENMNFVTSMHNEWIVVGIPHSISLSICNSAWLLRRSIRGAVHISRDPFTIWSYLKRSEFSIGTSFMDATPISNCIIVHWPPPLKLYYSGVLIILVLNGSQQLLGRNDKIYLLFCYFPLHPSPMCHAQQIRGVATGGATGATAPPIFWEEEGNSDVIIT